MINYEKLSKEVSYALRHAPYEYELELDELGFVDIEQLLYSINENNKYDKEITIDDLYHIIEISDKKRHEICDNKIRALYGHSLSNKILKEKAMPPDILYHGTTHKALDIILSEGLKPMNRQYVHLSKDATMANIVGKRRDDNPIILKIDAKKAYEDGVVFYIGNDHVWLADYIDSKYISVL